MADDVPQNVWDAVVAFQQFGSVDAGVFLNDLLYHIARSVSISRRSLFPRMLTDAVAGFYTGTLPGSLLLFVAILNRIFCMQAITEAFARPVNDGRPLDIGDLLPFYVECLQFSQLSLPVMEQLYLCVATVLLLQQDTNFVGLLMHVFGGTVPEMTDDAYRFIRLLSAVMNVLSDRRVPLGPIRRSGRRVIMQKNMHLLLTPMQAKDLDDQASVVAQGVAFLCEGSVVEPQSIAQRFWELLPFSTFWRVVLERLRQGVASESVLEAVCAVLRIISRLDDSALTLLLTALEAVICSETQAPILHVCRVVNSALESSVEAVLVQLGSGHKIYELLTSGAHVLQTVLIEHTLTAKLPLSSDILLVVCEGLSVLAQVLTPVNVPEMETTDDPDDYAAVVSDVQEANEQKRDAFVRLCGFLKGCRSALLLCLERLSVDDLTTIALYLRQNDCDEFAVWHDELPVAFFTTYERLCRLLFTSQDDTLFQPVSKGHLTVVAWHSELSYMTLVAETSDSLLWQRQVSLIPAVVFRHQKDWKHGHKDRVISSLIVMLQLFVLTLEDVASAATITEALRELNLQALPCVMQVLWRGICLPCINDNAPRWILASYLSFLMEQGNVFLPCDILDSSGLDDCTLVELYSCTLSTPYDVCRVMELLCRIPSDAVQGIRAAERIAAWVENTLTVGSQDYDYYVYAVREWCATRGHHFNVAWRLVRSLNSAIAAEILSDTLGSFVAKRVKLGDMEWEKEADYFSLYVLDTIAQSLHASCLQSILFSLLELSQSIGYSSVLFCLRAVVRGGVALLEARSCSPAFIWDIFCRTAKEYVRMSRGLCLELRDVGPDDPKLLRDISRMGRAASTAALRLPADEPEWLRNVCNAVDEFEIEGILRGVCN